MLTGLPPAKLPLTNSDAIRDVKNIARPIHLSCKVLSISLSFPVEMRKMRNMAKDYTEFNMFRCMFLLALLTSVGCGKTEVNAPGVKIKAGPDGVKVDAPGVKVNSDSSGTKVDVGSEKK
jgi:hypothetical protein